MKKIICCLLLGSQMSIQTCFADDEAIAHLAKWIARSLEGVPDCSIRYECVSHIPVQAAVADESASLHEESFKKGTFEFCKQGEKFFVKWFDDEDVLESQLSFDGKTYYCLMRYPRLNHLWVGSPKGVIKSEIFSKLMNSPFYANIHPLLHFPIDDICFLDLTDSESWVKYLSKFEAESDSEGFILKRTEGEVDVAITISSNLEVDATATIGGGIYGESRILERFTPDQTTFPIPSLYYGGVVDDEYTPMRGGFVMRVDQDSFRMVQDLEAHHFVVPSAMADKVIDVDLQFNSDLP